MPPSPEIRRTTRARIAVGLALVLGVTAYIFQSPVSSQPFASAQPNGLYGFLTDALLSGQTHLKVAPHPALKRLPNPWAGNQGIPRIHDATYFNDQYYLYFSPVPALLICAPWKLVTGTFLTDGALATVGSLATLLLGTLLLWRCWRHWFDRLSLGWLLLGLALVSFGTEQPQLVCTNNIYPAPIAAANAFTFAAYLTLIWAVLAQTLPRRIFALAVTSLLWGLVVACRPNHVFCLPALGLAALYLSWQHARENGGMSRGRVGLLAAAVLPAMAIGALLALYNYARFGSVIEFGMSYQFAAGDQRTVALVSWESIVGNVGAYLLEPLRFTPYFPYVVLQTAGGGVLFGTPLALLALAWPLTLLQRSRRTDPLWIVLGMTLLADFCLSTISVGLMQTANERYRADFLPVGMLLAILTLYGLISWAAGPRFPARLWRLLLVALAGWTLFHALMVAFAHNGHSDAWRGLARTANRLTALVERASGVEFGPLTAHVRFTPGAVGRREALVSSGNGLDVLYVAYTGENEIRLGFDHYGAGGPVSDPMTIDFGREYRLQLDLGCFYPPATHPRFSGQPELHVRRLQRKVQATLEGTTLLDTGSHFHAPHPWNIRLGAAAHSIVVPDSFTGTLRDIRQAGLAGLASVPTGVSGPLRLTVRFPEFVHFKTEPLVSTGHQGAGDLLYVAYVAPGKIRFGHDSWNGGSVETNVVDYVPGEPQVLEVDLPSLYFTTARPSPGRFILSYNGAIVMADDRPYHPSTAAELVLGFNGCDSSAARMNFFGKIDRVEPIAPLVLPEQEFQHSPGPIRLVLKFPPAAAGRSEPLLVTGRTGAADVIYVRYVDDSHVRFGYDHWNKGGPVSEPVAVDFAATHTVEIQLGSLYPRQPAPPEAVVVRLNGEVVLQHRETAYPTEPAEITPGLNSIGASTCERLFTGKIFFQERIAP